MLVFVAEFGRSGGVVIGMPMEIGIVGIGRMGWVHASHLIEIGRETGACALAAVVDGDVSRLERFRGEMQYRGPVFLSVED